MGRVLVVGDPSVMRKSIVANLRQDGYEVFEAQAVKAAYPGLAANNVDMIFAEMRTADSGAVEVLSAAHGAAWSNPVVFLAPNLEVGLECMRQGAFDFVLEPFQRELVRAAARRACEHAILSRENFLLRKAFLDKGSQPASLVARVDNILRTLHIPSIATPGQDIATSSSAAPTTRDAGIWPPDFFNLSSLLENVEKELIERTLSATGGAQAEAARRMGLSRSALAYKIHKYAIEVQTRTA